MKATAHQKLIGQRFGRLTAIAAGSRTYHVLCRCDCGNQPEVQIYNLRSGRTKSCGCIRAERQNHTTHGLSGTLTWKRWQSMRARCLNRNSVGFKNYGGRGITICDRWESFDNFLTDMGECPGPAMTLERVKNHLGYEPGNCIWATKTEQARNTRSNRLLTLNGETLGVSVWAERTGIKPQTILNRLRYGWSVEKALTELSDGRAKRRPRP